MWTKFPLDETAPSTRWRIALIVLVLLLPMPILLNQLNECRRGDAGTDSWVLAVGDNFYRLGFLQLKFLPVLKFEQGQPVYYTHLPPLPYIFNGFLRHIGIHSVTTFRLISILFSTLALLVLFNILQDRFRSWAVGVLSVGYLGFSGFHLIYADPLHVHPFPELFRFLSILLLVRGLESVVGGSKEDRGRTFWRPSPALYLRLAFVALFLLSLITYEYLPATLSFFLVYTLIVAPTRFRQVILGSLVALLLGIGLHFAQNVWALGGLVPAAADLWSSILYRTFEVIPQTPVLENVYAVYEPTGLTVFGYLSHLETGIAITSAFDRISLLLALPLAFYLVRKVYPGAAAFISIFALSSVTWWLVFPQHSYVHYYWVAGHVAPFLATAFGIIATVAIQGFRRHGLKTLLDPTIIVCTLVGSGLLYQLVTNVMQYLADSVYRAC